MIIIININVSFSENFAYIPNERPPKAFNRSGTSRAAALDISQVSAGFDMLVFFTNKSYGILGQIFFSFLRKKLLRVVLDGRFSKEFPVNDEASHGYILGPKLFLLYLNDLLNDVICNIAIYVDDTTLHSQRGQSSELWQQLKHCTKNKVFH